MTASRQGGADRSVLVLKAQSSIGALTDLLGAIGAEAKWLAEGDDARFMSDVALRLQPDD